MRQRPLAAIQVPVAPQSGLDASSGLAAVGQGLQSVGAEVQRRIQEKQKADDAAAFVRAQTEYSKGIFEISNTVRDEAAPDGTGMVETFQKEADALRANLIQNLGNVTDKTREAIDLQLQAMTGNAVLKELAVADGLRSSSNISAIEELVQSDVPNVINDPDQAAGLREQAMAAIQAISGDLDPNEEKKLKDRVNFIYAMASVEGFAGSGQIDKAVAIRNAVAKSLSIEQQSKLDVAIARGYASARKKVVDSLSLEIAKGEIGKTDILQMNGSGELSDADTVKLLSAAEAQQNKRQSDRSSQLDVGIQDGSVTRGLLDAELSAGNINTTQYAQRLRQLNSEDSDKTNLASAIKLFASDTPNDPTDSNVKKAADILYKASGQKELLVDLQPEARDALVNFSTQEGVIPSIAANTLSGMAFNGSDDQAAYALDTIAALQEENNRAAYAAFDNNELSLAIAYRERAIAGVPRAQIIDQLKKEAQPKDPQRLKFLKREASKVTAKFDAGTIKSALDTNILPGFGSANLPDDPVAENAMVRAYSAAFSGAFVRNGGNKKEAIKLANASIKRVWGISRVNGKKRLMMYPPEHYYGLPNVDNRKWMRKQVEALGEDVQLVADPQTAAEAQSGVAPSYVVIQTKDGITAATGRFKFDTQKAQKEISQKVRDKFRKAQRSAPEKELVGDFFGKVVLGDPMGAGINQAKLIEQYRKAAKQRDERFPKDKNPPADFTPSFEFQ